MKRWNSASPKNDSMWEAPKLFKNNFCQCNMCMNRFLPNHVLITQGPLVENRGVEWALPPIFCSWKYGWAAGAQFYKYLAMISGALHLNGNFLSSHQCPDSNVHAAVHVHLKCWSSWAGHVYFKICALSITVSELFADWIRWFSRTGFQRPKIKPMNHGISISSAVRFISQLSIWWEVNCALYLGGA